jgi:hypothetical protein
MRGGWSTSNAANLGSAFTLRLTAVMLVTETG